ncbi:hypothetical protein LOD99_14060 [Oopsacas minuta]|uniref:Glutathione synthetase n=1 Tax=Oopsacas minuta TaxID=111878 RepID=A0AAV7KID5_9METZ|nr:hypothetical protein LOD99_14060 [Oopsacas minuta]
MADWNIFNLQQIEATKFKDFVKLSRFYASSPVGLMMYRTAVDTSTKFSSQPLPFTLLPSPFPKGQFQEALDLQTHFNTLIHECTLDHEFLLEALEEPAQTDLFISKLLHLLKECKPYTSKKRVFLNMIRNDYMLHPSTTPEQIKFDLKQVEINTIAAGFVNIGPRANALHKFTLNYYQELTHSRDNIVLPENKADELSALAMATAYNKYCEVYNAAKSNTIILFIVVSEEKEYNVFDQRPIEVRLFEEHRIRVRRLTLQSLIDKVTIGDKQELRVDGEEIAVAYFRSGYNEKFYPTEKEWKVRTIIEQSNTVCVPSIAAHLATFKSIQQKLCEAGAVEKYIKDPNIVKRIRDTFAEQIALDGSKKAQDTIALVRKNPKLYVLKPNKEGGGNNYFDDDILPVIKAIENTDEMKNHILMQRLNPPDLQMCLVNPNKEAYLTKGNSELGIFGYYVKVDDKVEMNVEGGHVLRSKDQKDNECGISTGIGYVDSPYLV